MKKQLENLLQRIINVGYTSMSDKLQLNQCIVLAKEALVELSKENSRWISITDSLPKENDVVLMYEAPNVIYGYYGRLNRYSKQKIQFLGSNMDWDGGSLPVKPTHWQPIPQSPSK